MDMYGECGVCLNQSEPLAGSGSPPPQLHSGGWEMTERLSKGGGLPSVNFHRPRKGRAVVAVELHVFINMRFIECENGSQPGHLHDLVNNQPARPPTRLLTAFLPIVGREEGPGNLGIRPRSDSAVTDLRVKMGNNSELVKQIPNYPQGLVFLPRFLQYHPVFLLKIQSSSQILSHPIRVQGAHGP